MCCISGNRESGRELLEFYITEVLGSENTSNSDPSGKAAWRRNVAGFHGPLGKAERLGLFLNYMVFVSVVIKIPIEYLYTFS